MKKEWLPAVLLTLVCLVLVNGLYTAMVFGLAQLTPQQGMAERIKAPNGQLYYANIAQKFTDDRYFWPRPSAVDYNAAGSGGSNKGPSNPDYLKSVADRTDTFLVHSPSVKRSDIPAEMVATSGSGLDPDLPVAAAEIQIARVAKARGLPEEVIRSKVVRHAQKGLAGMAPDHINVLKLNLAIDQLK